MITYVLSQVQRFLREALILTAAPQVTVNRTKYVVHVDDVLHQVRRDRVCDCGGTPQFPCPALPLVQEYLAAGGQRPLGRHEDTWPERWLRIPPVCPICDCPTLPDRYVDSSHGPGWRCTFDPQHYWLVRMNPLRRYLAAHPPQSQYPWNGESPEEQRAWLEAHTHPLRVVPSRSNGGSNALDGKKKSQGSPRAGAARPGLDVVRLPRGPERPDDRLLGAGVRATRPQSIIPEGTHSDLVEGMRKVRGRIYPKVRQADPAGNGGDSAV